MKKLFLNLINWVKNKLRKRQYNQRQDLYDDVINKLKPKVEAKQKHQKALINEIKTHLRKKYGFDGQSEFIPAKGIDKAMIKSEVSRKFTFRMQKLNVQLTEDLKLICA